MALDRAAIVADGIEPVMVGYFDTAAGRGFPLFLDGEATSNAINATPYAIGYPGFRAAFAAWPGRAALIRSIDSVRDLANRSVTVVGMMIGGSFLDPAIPAPGDVDLLMLYRDGDRDAGAGAARLADLRRTARTMDVDVRFIPLDHDPLMLVKIVSYFTTLYNRRKGFDVQLRGLILIDFRSSPTS